MLREPFLTVAGQWVGHSSDGLWREWPGFCLCNWWWPIRSMADLSIGTDHSLAAWIMVANIQYISGSHGSCGSQTQDLTCKGKCPFNMARLGLVLNLEFYTDWTSQLADNSQHFVCLCYKVGVCDNDDCHKRFHVVASMGVIPSVIQYMFCTVSYLSARRLNSCFDNIEVMTSLYYVEAIFL